MLIRGSSPGPPANYAATTCVKKGEIARKKGGVSSRNHRKLSAVRWLLGGWPQITRRFASPVGATP
jgi:hypothetical protein